MFKFFKDKLKKAIGKFSKGVDEETLDKDKLEDTPTIEEQEVAEEKQEITEKIKEEITEQEIKEDKIIDDTQIPEEREEIVLQEEVSKERDSKEETTKDTEDEKSKKSTEPEKKLTKKIDDKEQEIVQETPETIQEVSGVTEDKEKEEEVQQIKEVKPIEEKPTEEDKSSEEKVKEQKTKEKPIEEKKGIFSRIKDKVTKRSLSDTKFNDLFWELEVVMLENNVAFEVIEKIKQDLKTQLVDTKVGFGKTEQTILDSLKGSISSLFDVPEVDLLSEIKNKKPYIILFIGVNGVGKTTTIAKLVHFLKNKGISCVVAACDTFRSAAIQQLEEHTKKLDVKLIKHDYGSDPSAVAFDSIKYAKSKNLDVVLIDTAGRQHSNANLMEEMKKMTRIAKPDLKIFVGESTTGNDCVEQAKQFGETVELTE